MDTWALGEGDGVNFKGVFKFVIVTFVNNHSIQYQILVFDSS